jgi:hypothetical protein
VRSGRPLPLHGVLVRVPGPPTDAAPRRLRGRPYVPRPRWRLSPPSLTRPRRRRPRRLHRLRLPRSCRPRLRRFCPLYWTCSGSRLFLRPHRSRPRRSFLRCRRSISPTCLCPSRHFPSRPPPSLPMVVVSSVRGAEVHHETSDRRHLGSARGSLRPGSAHSAGRVTGTGGPGLRPAERHSRRRRPGAFTRQRPEFEAGPAHASPCTQNEGRSGGAGDSRAPTTRIHAVASR